MSEIQTENYHQTFTDHKSIIGKIKIPILATQPVNPSNIEETIFSTINFKECDQEDWGRFRFQLHQSIQSFKDHENDETIEPIYNKFKNIIQSFTTNLLPKKTNSGKNNKKDTIPKFAKKLMKRRQKINKALELSKDPLKVANITTEIDTITETIEVSLSNHILNKEIKATNMLKHNPKAF